MVPVKLISESFPGQFKNWFYSLIVMSTVLEGRGPTETVFGYATVHDENDEEMHKSKGNAIWFDDAVEKIGADPMRWMYARQNPVDNLRFGYHNAEEVTRKLLTLYNVYSFFDTYVAKEEIVGLKDKAEPKTVLDQWIVSRLNNLIAEVTKDIEGYNVGTAVLAMEDFFINDLSLWYVRRSRKRFHEDSEGRPEAVQALYCLLVNLTKLIAPIMPFFAEEMYQNLKTGEMPESVHLCDWPKADKKLIDKKLEEKMAQVRDIVALALAVRAASEIKIRYPLQELKIKNTELKKEKELLGLVKEEVNVKEISCDSTIEKEIELNTEVTKELEKEGIIRDFVRNVKDLRKKKGLTPKDKIMVYSTFTDFSDKESLLKEVGAEGVEIKKENEMGAEKQEIKLGKEKHYIEIYKK